MKRGVSFYFFYDKSFDDDINVCTMLNPPRRDDMSIAAGLGPPMSDVDAAFIRGPFIFRWGGGGGGGGGGWDWGCWGGMGWGAEGLNEDAGVGGILEWLLMWKNHRLLPNVMTSFISTGIVTVSQYFP